MSDTATHVWTCLIITSVSAGGLVGFCVGGRPGVALLFVLPTIIGAFATGLWYATWQVEG